MKDRLTLIEVCLTSSYGLSLMAEQAAGTVQTSKQHKRASLVTYALDTTNSFVLLLLLLLLQALQLYCLRVLTFSANSFHLTRSCMHSVYLLTLVILKSFFFFNIVSSSNFWSSSQPCRYRFPPT
jgi:hypothetical protein